MVTLEILQAEAKRDLTNAILEEMENYLDNSQLMELNQSLNSNLSYIEVYKHNQTNADFEERNRELKEAFIKDKKLIGLSPKSLTLYSNELDRFIKWASKLVLDFEPKDIREYLMFRKELFDCGNVSLNNVRRQLSSFYKWLEVEEYILRNPIKAVGKIKEETRIKKPFTDEEIEKMRNLLTLDYDERDIALFELLLSSGIRLSECINLNIDDIDFENRKFTVIGKGNKERVCYFGTKAKIALEEYLICRVDDNPALFVSIQSPYKRLGQGGLGSIIREIGRECGVYSHPHKFRRTLASRLNKRNVPLEQIQKILGHENITTTMIYVSIDPEDVKMNYSKHIK